MPDPLDWISSELRRFRSDALYREPRTVRHLGNVRCDIGGREMIDFGSNDYLNLASSKTLRQAALNAVSEYGVGARASALVSGKHPAHDELCQVLAEFENAESAILFPTGYMANVGTITALVGSDDTVLCDRWNHASLIDGCRLSRARFRVYPHSDLATLERELKKVDSGRRLIVTDGLFSMDGDLATIPELWSLARQYDSMLLVDEAHATGVLGEHGRGSVEHFGLEDASIVRVGTLSKAIGSLGGFVTGPQSLIDYLRNSARTQIYTTGPPAALCAAATAALRHIQEHPHERLSLLKLGGKLRQFLSERDLQFAPGACGPIIPVVLDDPERAIAVSAQLQKFGYFVPAIRPPTVPQGTSRLRITLSIAHTEEMLESLVTRLRELL